MHRKRSDGHAPRAGGHIGSHVEWSTLEMVAHVALHVGQRKELIRFDPKREVVTLAEIAVDVGQIQIHIRAMVAEEAPYAGVGIAHILEIDRAIGVAEREARVVAKVEAHFLGERDDIPSVDTLDKRVVDKKMQMFAA